MDEREFRGMGDFREHGFATEDFSDGYAIEATDEFAILIYLDAVGMCHLMEFYIAGDHIIGNPCAILVGALGIGAIDHDLSKICVEFEY